jgi:hypothetical protein
MAKRPRLVKVGAEMQRWCALIEEEVAGWPNVSARPMFGLMAFYRGPVIFTAIPRTRAVDGPYSIIVKLPGSTRLEAAEGLPRRSVAKAGPGGDWHAYAMESEHDVAEALRWIEKAYVKARNVRSPRPGRKSSQRL